MAIIGIIANPVPRSLIIVEKVTASNVLFEMISVQLEEVFNDIIGSTSRSYENSGSWNEGIPDLISPETMR